MTAWQCIGSICITDSAAGPEKLHQKAMAKSIQLSPHGIAVTTTVVIYNLHLLGFCVYITAGLCVVRACMKMYETYVCKLADISPRHQHLWCYF